MGTNYSFLIENVSLTVGLSSGVKKQVFSLVDTSFLLPNMSAVPSSSIFDSVGICFIAGLLKRGPSRTDKPCHSQQAPASEGLTGGRIHFQSGWHIMSLAS